MIMDHLLICPGEQANIMFWLRQFIRRTVDIAMKWK